MNDMIKADCERLAAKINLRNPNRKHVVYAIFRGDFGLRAVRHETDAFHDAMKKAPERLVGIYRPGVQPEWIAEDVAAMMVAA